MFSIIIPSYNQSSYISQAIESALAQTHKTYEIIVVDDGSTDNSLAIAKSYPVKVISQVNKGLSSARNTGIMNANGDYIFPLDADDMMLENCLERVAQTIQETNADIVAPSFKCFGKFNDPVVLMTNPQLDDFKTGNRIGYFSAIKKNVLLEVGGYNPKMIYGWEDYDIWFDLLKRGKKLITMSDILMLYRTKDNSMITEANKHSDELWAQIYKNHPDVFTEK